MYKCKYCNKEFEKKEQLGGHIIRCNNNPNAENNKKHINESHKKFNKDSLKFKEYNNKIEYHCQYCNKSCYGKNSLIQHEIRCKENPNKIDYFKPGYLNKNKIPWNKGLTKETDIRIKNSANLLHQKYINDELKIWCDGLTKETDTRIKNYVNKQKSNSNCGGYREKSGFGKSGYYKGIFCNSTWELAYVIYCLDHNMDIKRCNIFYTYFDNNNIEHKYYPDFIVNDKIIEIKGYISENWKLKLPIVKKEHIKVLYKQDMQNILDYVISNYGKDLTSLYD